jgi:hypothetical protein
MREPQDKTVDGCVYTVRPLSGMRAVTFLPFLNKLLGPALAALAGSLTTTDKFQAALAALGDRLDGKEMEVVTRTLLSGCTFQPQDGSPGGELLPLFDLHMQGRPEVVFQLLVFALEVNYSGFFPMLGDLVARARAAGLPSPTKMPSSGPAGV